VRAHHGGKLGSERDTIIEDFREKKFTFLVTTAVVGRGLDVPQVNFVVNLDLPRVNGREHGAPDSREFIHRIGRAGRVDRKGIAIAFIDGEFDKEQDIDLLFNRSYKTAVPFKKIDAGNVDGLMDEIIDLQAEQSSE
jgi:superfamily II DNA/RNA helicase